MNSRGIAILIALLAIVGIYFGLDTIPKDMKKTDEVRQKSLAVMDVRNLLLNAEKEVPKEMMEEISLLQHEARQAKTDSVRIERWKALSNRWYTLKHYGIAGHYAEEIAELTQTSQAWSIAGTTYTMGLLSDHAEDDVRKYCADKAESAFQNAISLDPDELDYKLNLATSYAEYPPEDNPMKGILMLLELSRSNPEYMPVLLTLARFGLRTGQYEKAAGRLETVLSQEPDNVRAHCLLAEAYAGLEKADLALKHKEKCSAGQSRNK